MALFNEQSSGSKPILHVECCIDKPDSSPGLLAKEVASWLRANFEELQVKRHLSLVSLATLPCSVEFLKTTDVTSNLDTDLPAHALVRLNDVEIDVDVFCLHSDDNSPQDSMQSSQKTQQEEPEGDLGSFPEVKTMALPNRSLNGIWDSLIFEDQLHSRLLKFVVRMARQPDRHLVAWNRTILLHGPPGTGKTNLCRALAQQLSIRLGTQFPVCKLVEFYAYGIFSKYFSERSKKVTKLIAMVEKMLEEGKDNFVCLFIDEIESLAITQHSSTTNEPKDSLRAINALLVALDRLRCRGNVLVLCTSNLIEIMDPAFLDRVDIKQCIPEPCSKARYEILRTTYLAMVQSGIIARPRTDIQIETWSTMLLDAVGSSSPVLMTEPDEFEVIGQDDIPPVEMLAFQRYADESCLARRLWRLAEKTSGMSGRTLRRLPMLSLAMYTRQDPCPVDGAFAALSKAVDDQKARMPDQISH